MSGLGSLLPPNTVMAAPQGPTTIRLQATPSGMQAFLIKLPGILGNNLTQTLHDAQHQFVSTQSWAPTTTAQAALYTHIFNRVVPALEGNDSLLVRMAQACTTNGPQAIAWLKAELDPQTESSAVLRVIKLFTKTIDDESAIADVQSIISSNDTLAGSDFFIHPKLLSALLLAKFPPSLVATRAAVIQQPTLPSPQSLVSMAQTAFGFDYAAAAATASAMPSVSHTAFAFASQYPCINCDSVKHTSAACTQPPTPCDACGVVAGHMAKHCFVKNPDKPLPKAWDPARKQAMAQKRDQYRIAANKPTSMLICAPASTDSQEFDDNFWEMMENGWTPA